MSLFKKFKSIFKKPEKVEKAKKVKKPKKVAKPKKSPFVKTTEGKKVEVAKKEEIKKPPAKRPPVKKKPTRLVRGKDLREVYKVLKEPHISEKATGLSERNKYVFKIYPRANKIETKKAIENLYGVKVKDVHIINVPRKKRRLGRAEGWKTGYKKAIVTLKEGEKIEILPH